MPNPIHTEASSPSSSPTSSPPASEPYISVRCATPSCRFNAKVGTPLCGFCHIAAGTYWNSPVGKTPLRKLQPPPPAPTTPVDAAPPPPVTQTAPELPAARSPRLTLAPRCAAIARSGDPCRFAARRQSTLCINHDPAYREEQQRNRRRGSANARAIRSQPPISWDALDFSNRASIQAALESVVRLDLEGRLSAARTRTLIRSLALAARNFDHLGLTDRRRGAHAQHDAQGFDAARRRCAVALEAILPPASASS